ncbi:Uncharacterised protein [Bordetella ansorpii]|uniref:Uncharacterized protein n=1 Tax=Bordetella ansorpii TaxID=288768 RepID=A0A157SXB2_9BORD|nr:hypothetical protein [Bordetella ansorpii]SAI74596.1 Uncharacterised protein [Bordetella ansorpii]
MATKFSLDDPLTNLGDIEGVRIGEILAAMVRSRDVNRLTLEFGIEGGAKIAIVLMADSTERVDSLLQAFEERVQIGPTDI